MRNYKFNLRPSPYDHRDHVLDAIKVAHVRLPKEFNLRNQLQPVRDQGSQGTCSAQTASCMKEWQEKIDIGLNEYLSPQFVYNLRSNEGEGMFPRDTMKILQKIGIVLEKEYPYNTRKRITEQLKEAASRFKIKSYARVKTIDGLKKSLFINGPCYIAFPVYNPESYKFWRPHHANQQSIGGHAVVVVGWTKTAFIIRNSWGTNWGRGGYCYFPYSDWGMHWELWTAVDEKTYCEKMEKENKRRKGILSKIFGF